jgi:transcription elongation factor Elf1
MQKHFADLVMKRLILLQMTKVCYLLPVKNVLKNFIEALKKMRKYKSTKNGEAITLLYKRVLKIKGTAMNFSCCDCGLTHKIVILPLKTRVKIYFWRDNRATANIRRGKQFEEKAK